MKIEPFALERWMTTYEMKVGFDIAESGIFPMTIQELLQLEATGNANDALDQLLNLRLGYSEAPGSAELRRLLADTYAATGEEEILVTTGAIEANFLLFNVLLEAGDHVVVVHPCYQQLESVPKAIGCDVSRWNVRNDGESRFEMSDLEELVTSQTRLIVINSPHNPTGAVLSDAQLRQVYAIAESIGATVLSDEAYRWLSIPGEEALPPPVRNLGDRGVSVGTFSKPFGLPGIRIGLIAAPADLVAKCWAMRDYVSLSPGKLNDALAVMALKQREKINERTQRILAANLETADRWFAKHAELASWNRPRGGLLSLLRYNVDMPSLALANHLAEEFGVMLAPGAAFGFEGHLRIGIGQEPAIFAEGLERTARCLNALQSADALATAGAAGR